MVLQVLESPPKSVRFKVQTLFTYDSRHRLADFGGHVAITQQLCVISSGHSCSSTTTLATDSHAYDENDNRTQVSENNGATSSDRRYCYDALNQLVYRNTGAACSSGANDEVWTYDDAGNRLSAKTGGVTTNFAYTAEGLLCDARTGAASCSGGNVTSDSAGRIATYNGWTYGYDADGRLVTACKNATCAAGSDAVTFAYDGEGHRTSIAATPAAGTSVATTTFRYQGDAVVQDVTTVGAPVNSTTTRTFTVDSSGRIVRMTIPSGTSAGTYHVTWNGHGDALALWLVNADGTLTLANSFTYDTWGTPTTTTAGSFADLGFRYLYVGGSDVEWDDELGLGLSYMHARYQSPTLGRFIQPDPSSAEANLFGYGKENPTSTIDPTGLIGSSFGPPNQFCRDKYQDLVDRALILIQRSREQIFGLVAKSAGHAQRYYESRDRLRLLIDQYETRGCPDSYKRLPRTVYHMANRPFPQARGGANFAALFGGLFGGGAVWWMLKLLSPGCGPVAPVCAVAL